MDKIQELHKDAWLLTTVPETFKANATITEDLMGRFAKWVVYEGFELKGELWERMDANGLMVYPTSELIQLFKETCGS